MRPSHFLYWPPISTMRPMKNLCPRLGGCRLRRRNLRRCGIESAGCKSLETNLESEQTGFFLEEEKMGDGN